MNGRRGSSLLFFALLSIQACAVDRGGLGTEAQDGAPPRADAAIDGDVVELDAGPDAQIEPPDGCVPSAELCNGVDDDCDPSTADGADEATLGDTCDGDDSDLCAEGSVACAEGALICDDATDDALELCNGMDDDCDPATADGADEATLGDACDGADGDLCPEGAIVCTGGGLACDDATGDALELCNGVDDDCDPATADGADEATLGDACDGADDDLCDEGAIVCTGGGLACDDVTGDALELCNGTDDDCDPSTADGADEPMLGASCDGADSDLCEEGTNACMGGGLVCSDASGDDVEMCNGTDDDCDPSTADGAGDPAVGIPCDGADSDSCLEGTSACSSGGVVCSDVTDDDVETCNGADDDCDGTIDEGAGCPCEHRTNAGRSYLFCGDWTDRRTFSAAATFCASMGYSLVQIDDATENAWVASQMAGIRADRDWWIGATDRAAEGTWLWTDGSATTYDNWGTSQPNDSGDCAEMDPSETVMSTLGSWNDVPCGEDKRFVCEAGP